MFPSKTITPGIIQRNKLSSTPWTSLLGSHGYKSRFQRPKLDLAKKEKHGWMSLEMLGWMVGMGGWMICIGWWGCGMWDGWCGWCDMTHGCFFLLFAFWFRKVQKPVCWISIWELRHLLSLIYLYLDSKLLSIFINFIPKTRRFPGRWERDTTLALQECLVYAMFLQWNLFPADQPPELLLKAKRGK